MRWKRLFADLEAQLDAADDADPSKHKLALTTLSSRLSGSVDATVSATVRGAGTVRGAVRDVGTGWLLLGQGTTESLIALDAVTSISGLGPPSAVPPTAVQLTLGLTWALRGLVRDRAGVTVVLVDGTAVTGTPDRVGADFLDLAEHALGEPRRAGAVSSVRTVPLASLALLRRA